MAEPSPCKLRVLVADDEPDTVKTLTQLLREEGHEVRGVHSGLDVLAGVRDFGPDVVLLDIGMPQVNGYQVARTLRERYGSARPLLIAVTGRTLPSERNLAQLAGFDHHVGKPYDPQQLIALLASPLTRAGPGRPPTRRPAP